MLISHLISLSLIQWSTSAAFAEIAAFPPLLNGLKINSQEVPADAPTKLPQKRGPSSFVTGQKDLKENCPIFPFPNPLAQPTALLKKGTQIWLEGVDSKWARGKIKKKVFFIPLRCL